MISMQEVMVYAYPMIKNTIYSAFGIALVGGLAYYLFVIKRRRTWFVNIWEQKADGRLQLITKDTLIEKKINKNKLTIYRLKRQNDETFPPPWEAVYRVRGKEYCDYLRIRDEYIPFERAITGTNNLPDSKKGIITKIRETIYNIHKNPLSSDDFNKRFVFIPINQSLSINVSFKTMDYDINMMRVNAIDLRDKIYADKQDWLQKYGTFVAFGIIVVLIIVVLYLSYDYSEKVLAQAYAKASETLSMVQQVANKLGGVPPPQ